MPTTVAIQQWLGEQIVPVFLIGFAILMGFGMVYLSAMNRRNALARSRAGRTEETFAEYLAKYGFDQDIAKSTYRYLQDKHRVSFPIEPMDDLDRDLGLDGDDVKTTLRELLDENGREYLPGIQDSPLVRVVDLVRYIQASPRRLPEVRRRLA
ncbi:MAG TPA: hypothetical protein VHU44_13460 [Acidobacteriaceae bacterium]|jgi:hypothetical protein|nr:hypothetical protein [Acidobacteriaceae bacterium]